MWELISNSKGLEDWGPPVRQVRDIDSPEQVGSWRTVVAEFTPRGRALTAEASASATKKQVAHFGERRTEHMEGRSVAYRIEEEDIGMFDLITNVGYRQELAAVGPNRTRVIWTFFHDPRGIVGTLKNPLVRRQQRANRRAALRSLKQWAEANTDTAVPG